MRIKKGSTGIMNGRNARVITTQASGVLSRNRSLNIFRASLLVLSALSLFGFGALEIAKAKRPATRRPLTLARRVRST